VLRITFLLRRRSDLTRGEFQEYWRRTHGPLVAGFGTALCARRYVQVHTIDDPANAAMAAARGGMEDPYDGVAELWWDDEERFAGAMSSSEGQEAGAALLADEARFIDLPNSPIWFSHEYPQVNPTPENLLARPRSSLVKLYYPLRSRGGLSEEDAQLYWRTNHGPLIRSQATASGILRYVQVHRFPHPAEQAMREVRGVQVEAYMGHAELWFDRRNLGGDHPEARAAGARAVADETRFIDFSRSCMWLAKEHVFIDHTQGD
jgi:uncharacterized protein (TIGR02118 family)